MSALVRSTGLCEARFVSQCGGGLQDNHILPKSHYPSLRYDILNHVALCYRHHIYWWHKSPLEAIEWLQETFPHRYTYLMAVRHNHKKLTKDDYEKIRKAIKERDFDSLVMFPE